MSPSIWTPCGGKCNLARFSQSAWRVVEDQFNLSTRPLVDSSEEQEQLEALIEAHKPPIRAGPEWAHLHYLLSTPFRYPPLPHGSRFGTRFERGIWYGSALIETALAETAFWQMLLLRDTSAVMPLNLTLTAFSVRLKSDQAADLTVAPFDTYRERISSPVTYTDSQPLGTAMRKDGAEFCRYMSARDPKGGKNVAVFSPAAFSSRTVSNSSWENWHCLATKTEVELQRRDFINPTRLLFRSSDFEVKGHFPLMTN